MKVTNKMIDKELRTVGIIVKAFLRPSVTTFKFINFIAKKMNGKNISGLNCEEVWIPSKEENVSIRTRIYKPLNYSEKLPIMLYCHGGGYAAGTPEISYVQINDFMKKRPCIIVAPDYRKSIEHPYPAALNDCYDSLIWIKDNVDRLGARNDQIMVAGHSAGGGLTAAISLLARDKQEVKIAFQMPIYPMIDDRMITESAINNTAPVWNSTFNKLAWSLYLKDYYQNDKSIPVYAAPAREKDYSNLPPTATFVGDIEPFRDETMNYVKNLESAGVPIKFKLFEKSYHSFEAYCPKAKVSQEAIAFILEAYSYAVDNYFAKQDS